jgi:hypothetical protein
MKQVQADQSADWLASVSTRSIAITIPALRDLAAAWRRLARPQAIEQWHATANFHHRKGDIV